MDIKKCPECGAEAENINGICPNCGYKFEKAGKKLSSDETFTGNGVSGSRDSLTEMIRIKSDRHRALLTALKYGKYILGGIAALFAVIAVIEYNSWIKDTFRDVTFLKFIREEKWLIALACAFSGLCACYSAIKEYFTVLCYADWIRDEKFNGEDVMVTVAHSVSTDEKTTKNLLMLFAAAEFTVNPRQHTRMLIKVLSVFIASAAAAVCIGLFLFGNAEGLILYETEKYVKIQLGTPPQEFTGYVWNFIMAIPAAVLYVIAGILDGCLDIVSAEKLREMSEREIN